MPSKTSSEDVRLEAVGAVLSMSDFATWLGQPPRDVSPDALKQFFAQFNWRETFIRLSGLACIVANQGPLSAAARSWTHDLGRRFEVSPDRVERDLARYLSEHPRRAIASEQALYFAEAMALLYGAREEGSIPFDGNLVHLLLACNDHAFGWIENDDSLTRKERLLADMTRAATFNESGDRESNMVRGALLLATAPDPERTRWRSPAAWDALQRRAFGGMTATDYVTDLAGPLHLASVGWGMDDNAPGWAIIDIAGWLRETAIDPGTSSAFLRALCATPDEVRETLKKSLDRNGLPVGSAVFSPKPFLQLSDSRIVPASPWVVRGHLRTGLWWKMLDAAKEEFAPKKDAGMKAWSSTFGELVERWCHQLAEEAARSSEFAGRVLPRSLKGKEAEDVVLVSGSRAVLFSVKSRLVHRDVHKGARSNRAVVEYFEEVLFKEASGDFRAGAIRLLLKSIQRVRNRDFEPVLDHRVEIFPVLVTFDELGLDTPAAYQWITTRMNVLGLRLPRNTRRITFVTVQEFERLMALAENGHDVINLLALKTSPRWADARLDVLIAHEISDISHTRPRFIATEFDRLFDVIRSRLFPQQVASSLDTATPAATSEENRDA